MENKKKTVSMKNLRLGLCAKKVPAIGLKVKKIQLCQDSNHGQMSHSRFHDDMSDIQEILELFDRSDIGREYDELKVNSVKVNSDSPCNCNSQVECKSGKKEFIIRRSVRIHTNKA